MPANGRWDLIRRLKVNDVISPNVQVQCKLPDDGRRPIYVGAIFVCILM